MYGLNTSAFPLRLSYLFILCAQCNKLHMINETVPAKNLYKKKANKDTKKLEVLDFLAKNWTASTCRCIFSSIML